MLRSLVISMALITPLHSRLSTEIRGLNLSGGALESEQLLCVDLQTEELWSSAFEDPNHLKNLEIKWNPSLSKIKNVIIKRVSDEDLEAAATLLRSSCSFYEDTSCPLLPSGINLYMLLLWAYSLLHGYCTNVSYVIKYCEENAKSRMKKGAGGSSTPSNAHMQTPTASQGGGTKDAIGKTSEQELHSSLPLTPASLPETHSSHRLETGSTQKEPSTLAQNETTQHCVRDSLVEKDSKRMGSDPEPENWEHFQCALCISSAPLCGIQ
ncbi:UNVERIFIED_CONTAM: hypothetical protein Sangu_1622400 [Sesamum angustifolium]|uniref:Uncharacterized protein n=1 Tax=Sesamum angustifolium TaxID=2727405 RepID=A0AAW2MGR6_9LAMI